MEYENTRRVVYDEGMTFVPVCMKCGRFVKAPKKMRTDYQGQPKGNHAKCSRCGPTQMLFEGYY